MQPDDQGQPVVPASDSGTPVGGPMPGQTPPASTPMPVGGAEEPGEPTASGEETPGVPGVPGTPPVDNPVTPVEPASPQGEPAA